MLLHRDWRASFGTLAKSRAKRSARVREFCGLWFRVKEAFDATFSWLALIPPSKIPKTSDGTRSRTGKKKKKKRNKKKKKKRKEKEKEKEKEKKKGGKKNRKKERKKNKNEKERIKKKKNKKNKQEKK